MITVGSSWNGTRNPPAESVRDIARTISSARDSVGSSSCRRFVAALANARM
jgi:hypothetical protein